MTLLVPWLGYPLLLAVVTLGCGTLLGQAAGRRLPGVLLLPAGYAVIVVVSSLTTMTGATAWLTTPLVVLLALAGLVPALQRRARPDVAALVAGVAVFAVYAAPIVLSGSATFAGYISLDDTATWLALADNALAHGRDTAMLAPSTYSTVLHDYLSTGYPLGAFVPLGIGSQLTGTDAAWLFQPQIAYLAAMLGLSVYSLSTRMLPVRWLRGLTAVLGAQAALLYGYAFWSGIKEITAAALIALLVALIDDLPRARSSLRAVLPVACVAAALTDVLAIVGAVWFSALGLLVLAGLLSRHRRRVAILTATAVAAASVLALPALATARTFVSVANSGDISGHGGGDAGLGNLIHPLSYLQVVGIWPVGDFRLRPHAMRVTEVMIAFALLAGLAGLLVAVRRRAWGLPVYLAVAGGGAIVIVVAGAYGHGSPWLDGKALAIASPALVAAAAAGGGALLRRPTVALGALGLAAVSVGVLWSNALAYGNVWLAPRAQLGELETIGQRFAGDGPTLMTEYEPYGVRHFLRRLDPEGASERRARPVELQNGSTLGKAAYADIDAFALSAILVYRTLVLRTSPVASRPPSDYRLVWHGRYYEVWQRPARPPDVLEHLSLGAGAEPVAVPACNQVLQLAALAAQHGGALVASKRTAAIVQDLAAGAGVLPPGWGAPGGGAVVPAGPGSLTVALAVPSAGRYGFWLSGSFRDTVTISVDGEAVGSETDQLSEGGQLVPFGYATLGPGRHTVVLRYSRNRLAPGSGSAPFAFGPLEIGRAAASARLVEVAPARALSLCGKSLDWVEAVG